jgi:hypothetical protein
MPLASGRVSGTIDAQVFDASSANWNEYAAEDTLNRLFARNSKELSTRGVESGVSV